MNFRLKIWRQQDRRAKGSFAEYTVGSITPDMSFLEMLDALNLTLAGSGEDTVAFDHDCREGICGSCGIYINGRAHGPLKGVGTCQLYMRSVREGDEIV